jgi:hypothetical protein
MTPVKGTKNIITKANNCLSHEDTTFLKVNAKTIELNKINEASKEESNV